MANYLNWHDYMGIYKRIFSSDKTSNPWITDDERETKIKQKAIIASWSGVLCFVPLIS